MKAIRILLTVVGVLIVLIVGAAIIIPLVVDPNDFKPQIAEAVKDKTGRDLSIPGKIGLSVFPWVAIDLGEVSLSNAKGFGDQAFASIQDLSIRVKLMPLLEKKVELDTIVVDGLSLYLSRDASGKTNWDDLAGAPAEEKPAQPKPAEAPAGAPPIAALAVGGIKITDANVIWDDRQAGQRFELSKLSLTSGAIEPGKPVDLDLKFDLVGNQPPLDTGVALSTVLSINEALDRIGLKDLKLDLDVRKAPVELAGKLGLGATVDADTKAQHYSVSGLQLSTDLAGALLQGGKLVAKLSGEVDADAAAQRYKVGGLNLAADLSGPMLEGGSAKLDLTAAVDADVAKQLYQVADLVLKADAKGEKLPGGGVKAKMTGRVDADLAKQTLKVAGLSLAAMNLDISGDLQGEKIVDSPRFSGNLKVAPFNPRDLMQVLGQELPETADDNVLTKAQLDLKLAATQTSADLSEIHLVLDDSKLSGKAGVKNFDKPAVRFGLNLDRIDLDRYLPPAKEGATPTPAGPAEATTAGATELPLDTLRALDVDGTVAVGWIKVSNLEAEQLKLEVKAKDGDIKTKQSVGKLYEGGYESTTGLNVKGATPAWSTTQKLTGVQVGPLLADLTGEPAKLTGATRFNADIKGSGVDPEAAKKTANGKLDFAFTDGAVVGINIPRMIREAKAKLQGKTLPPEEGVQKTDFTEITGSATIANGVVNNPDLNAKSPYLRVTGKGDADVVNEKVNYLVSAELVSSGKGQGGEGAEDLKGIVVPIRVVGAFADPSFKLDTEALVAAIGRQKVDEAKAKAQAKVEEKLKEKLGDQLGSAGAGIVGGLLGVESKSTEGAASDAAATQTKKDDVGKALLQGLLGAKDKKPAEGDAKSDTKTEEKSSKEDVGKALLQGLFR